MNRELYVIALVGVLAALCFRVPVLGTFIKFRSKRVITCEFLSATAPVIQHR